MKFLNKEELTEGQCETLVEVGNSVTGFYGEVGVNELITGDTLAIAIGLDDGAPIADAGWLKFSLDGRVLYVAKRPLRHSISWNSINTVGAVFGTTTVVINGDTYKVRLLKGTNAGPVTRDWGYDEPYTHGSEWNRLLYRVSANPFGDTRNTLGSEGIATGDWASYSEADIGTAMAYTGGNGGLSWCQETGTTGTTRVSRGNSGVSHSTQDISSNVTTYLGWRPVLELVE